MRWLNRLVPPNVYYVETDHAGGRVRAKYALVSLAQLERLRRARHAAIPISGPGSPSRPDCCGRATPRWRPRSKRVLVQAILTTDQAVRPLVGAGADAVTLWSRALSESYRTELRAEKPGRASLIVAGDLERYRRVTARLGGSAARRRRPAPRHAVGSGGGSRARC